MYIFSYLLYAECRLAKVHFYPDPSTLLPEVFCTPELAYTYFLPNGILFYDLGRFATSFPICYMPTTAYPSPQDRDPASLSG